MQKFILFLLSFLLAISIFFTGCKKAEQIFAKSGEKSDEPVIQESISSDFFEDFDGTKLKNYWEVINPNTENFFMKNGELLVISSSDIKLSDKNVENVFRLKKSSPQGDWAMTA